MKQQLQKLSKTSEPFIFRERENLLNTIPFESQKRENWFRSLFILVMLNFLWNKIQFSKIE